MTASNENASADERRNFRILLGQGSAGSAGYELTSDQLVLPFLYTSIGAPIFFAGLLVPISTVSGLAAQIIAAPIVSAAQSNRWFVAIAAVATAVSLAVVCTTVNALPVAAMVAIFLVVAVILGTSNGVASLAVKNMLGRTLQARRRSRLLFTQSGLAGLLAIIVALASQAIDQPGTPLAADLELIWLGAGMYLLSGIAITMVREPAMPRPSEDEAPHRAPTSRIGHLREGFRVALALSWFRRFLVARTLFLSVELAMPFYSIHAATFHSGNVSGLSTFVIASSLGLVIGAMLWPRVGTSTVRLILVLAIGIAAVGGLLALAIEWQITPQSIYVYAVVFVLISLSSQGVRNGRTLYLVGLTTDQQRPFCLAVASVVTGLAAVAIGAILGTLASLPGVAWSIVAIVALNVTALVFTLTLGSDAAQGHAAGAATSRGNGA